MKKSVFILLIGIFVLVSVVGLVDARGAFGNLEDFFDIFINNIIDIIFPDIFEDIADILEDIFPAPGPECSSRADCLAAGNTDPPPYCEGDERVWPKVWCFNPGRSNAWCGIHNWGISRRACASTHFCREIDSNGDGVTDSLACAQGVAPGPQPDPPFPPGPPAPPIPQPPVPVPQPVACQSSADCSMPPGEYEANCEDRDRDGVNDELVRKKACCLSNTCNVCDTVNDCKYGCGWRADLNPPKTFCCTSNSPCNGPSCNNDGTCDPGEIPGVCADCPICEVPDGVCDREGGENFNNCPADCANALCCSDAECGPRIYECIGNEVKWTIPMCKNICTNDAFCSEGYAKTDCSKLGKICTVLDNGKTACR